MAVSSGEFIEFACMEIDSCDPSEFKFRNASSRAYYALFHKAQQKLGELGVSIVKVENSGSHSAVIETLRRISPKAKALATDMDRAKRFRNNCDYDLSSPVSHGKARKHVTEVRRLIDLLDRI